MTAFVGHFGSGKTEIALNRALDLAAQRLPVTLGDLDVVKPYFRSRSARELLAAAGVELLAPTGEHVHADLPIVVPRIRTALQESERRLILDVGGDDTGARVLGSLADVVPRDDTDAVVVLNFRRPSTPDVESAANMVSQIEAVARVAVTGLVANTHLMSETTSEIILEGYRLAEETARRLGIPLVAVAAHREDLGGLVGEGLACPILALRRIVIPPHELSIGQRTTGPLFVVN